MLLLSFFVVFQTESVILDDVKNIMAQVLAKLHNEECTDLNEFLM